MTPEQAILSDVQAAGGRILLRSKGVQVQPPYLLDAALRGRIQAHGAGLRLLLQQLDADRGEQPDAAAGVGAPAAPRYELCRIAAWDPERLIRLCAEPSHWHEDRIPTFDCVEIDLLLTWSRRIGVQQLSPATRAALLILKADFGGRIDFETIDQLDASS